MHNLDFQNILDSLSERTLREYHLQWDDYENLKRFSLDSYVNAPLLKYLGKRGLSAEGKSVLEFGCRNGSSFATWLSQNAASITGMDINPDAFKLSKLIFDDLGFNNIEYRQNFPGEKLPASDEEFDVVSCNAIIEHIHPNMRGFYIKELQRVLKPGGIIIFSDTPNRLSIKEGHTTGMFFVNFLPFRLKCWFGSRSKRFRGKIIWYDYDEWIGQGIVGVTYSEINKLFLDGYSNEHDLKFEKEYKDFLPPESNFALKKVYHRLLLLYATIIDEFFLKPKDLPSLAAAQTLIFSYVKK